MSYGIGRVPADVDLTLEAMAELEAEEIQARSWTERATEWEKWVNRDWKCTNHGCGSTEVNLAIQRSGLPGCFVLCEKCFLEYHKNRGQTLAEIAESYRKEREQTYNCARCGKAGAHWNRGAGEPLCERHWDSY